MKEVIVNAEQVLPKKSRLLSVIIAVLSTLVSLVASAYSFYLSTTWWFIPLGIYFVTEAVFLIVPLFIKDDYQAMRLQGVFQILSVILIMSYLLFMVLWNDPNTLMNYSSLTYLVLGVAAGAKTLIAIINRIIIKKNYHPLLHSYANGAFISAFYLILMIELILVNQFYPGESYSIFDNLLREKPIWIYVIDIALNATLTIFAALLALSTEIRGKTKEELSTTNKIKHTIKWFNDNEVTMFFGLIFTLYLAVLSIINMKQSFFYILLFFYYIGTALIRFINYRWHKHIQKKVGDNQIKDNRKSSWILLFDAVTYLFFSNVLVLGAIFMMIQKSNTGTNIYLFLFLIIPMGLMRFITSNKSVRTNRKSNNTYKLGTSLIGLVSVFFSILEIVAISCHELPVVWLRVIIIILAIIAVKIAVIVVSIIFVIHWVRSIILNNSFRERKLRRQRKE